MRTDFIRWRRSAEDIIEKMYGKLLKLDSCYFGIPVL